MQLSEMTWPQVDAVPAETPVLIPIAALEPHGRHLPVFTDSLLLGEVTRRAHEALAGRVLCAPLMWLGNSEHHLDFAGTMSAAPRTYLDLLKDRVGNSLFHGFGRIVLLNGHGEKGELLFRAFSSNVVALIERVIARDGREWDA